MCTVLVRIEPGAPWPLLLGAIRDEFVARSWDPPARYWTGPWATFVGGRDQTAGGTWLAVDPSAARPAVAALLNGPPMEPLADGGARPTRGSLALRALAGDPLPQGDELARYARFHLLVATVTGADLWTWDGEHLQHRALTAGADIVVNVGLDAADDPLVPHFAPALAALDAPDLDHGSWGGWPELLTGEHLPGDDPRALVVAKQIQGRAVRDDERCAGRPRERRPDPLRLHRDPSGRVLLACGQLSRTERCLRASFVSASAAVTTRVASTAGPQVALR